MKKRYFLISFLSLFALAINYLPTHAQSAAGNGQIGYRIVGASTLNVRSQPSTGNNVIGYLHGGDRIMVMQKDSTGSWCQINYDDQNEAWVYCPYLMLEASSTNQLAPSTNQQTPSVGSTSNYVQMGASQNAIGYRVVGAASLNVRSQPNTGNNVVGYLHSGDRIMVMQKDSTGSWCQVPFENRSDTWVYCPYLMQEQISPSSSGQVSSINLPAQSNTSSVSSNVAQEGTVNVSAVNVRSYAGMGRNIIGSLNYGDRVNIQGSDASGFWCKINYDDQNEAWVACKFLNR